MQIISGRFRHRKLFTSPGLITRPITARAKESLFEHLNPWLPDARIADVFSGTGTMGIESLSRGAKSVLFIEQDKVAIELLRKNIEMLKIEDETFVWQTDVLRTSYRPKVREEFVPYDVVFFDPPYKMVAQIKPGRMLFRSLERIADERVTAADALVLFRTDDHPKFELPRAWEIERTLNYSSMNVFWLRKTGLVSSQDEIAEEEPQEVGDAEIQSDEMDQRLDSEE